MSILEVDGIPYPLNGSEDDPGVDRRPLLELLNEDNECFCDSMAADLTCLPSMRWQPGMPALRFGGAS